MAAIGIILLIVGAIVAFGVDVAADGVDLHVIGLLVMAGGALALVAAAIQGAGWMSMSSTRMRTERHASDDGRHVVEETRVG